MFALLDMDSFYAQVESKRLGLTNDVPLGVKQHGHFIAVNYAARKRGVPSRCAVDKAKDICPEIVTAEVEMLEDVKPSLERYRRASEAVMRVVQDFVDDTCIERASIDEAYLDLTKLCANNPSDERTELQDHEKVIIGTSSVADEPPEEKRMLFAASTIMNKIREAIRTEVGFSCSCGIAHNKLLSKISASKNKPNGQTLVFKSGTLKLMNETSLRKIKGLGGKLGKALEALYQKKTGVSAKTLEGDNVLGAIQRGIISFGDLEREFDTKTARYIVSKAMGEDNSTIVSRTKPKTHLSIKQFYHTLNFDQVDDWLRLESEELARRAKLDFEQHHRIPSTIVLHVYRNSGDKISRRGVFAGSDFTNPRVLQEDIHRAALALFRKIDPDREGAKGIGVGLENFQEISTVSGPRGTSTLRITKFFGKSELPDFKNDQVPLPTDKDIIWQDDDLPLSETSRQDLEEYTSEGDGDDDDDDEWRFNGEEEDEATDLKDLFEAHKHDAGNSSSDAAILSRTLRPMTSREAGATEFVTRYFKASRLSFIGLWKRRFEELLETLPDPPALTIARERVLLHVDMDAFFCSASLLSRPELKDKPVAVCWSNVTSETTVTSSSAEISSCNYVARARGVRASMFLAKAKSLCPDLTCIPFDFELYESIGMEFYKLLFEVSPHVEGVSCDEAYIDVTHLVSSETDVDRIAAEVRSLIFKRTKGVTASVGAGRNRLIARLCTVKAKPNGYFSAAFWSDDRIFEELLNEDVNVSALPSIGHRTKIKLEEELEITDVKGLRGVPISRLKGLFGPKNGEKMANLSRGVDDRPWNPRPLRDSVSVQISWGVRMQNQREVQDFIQELASECWRRLGSRSGDMINLKLWRAVENQPEHMRKGQVGHGLCDILTRSRARTVKGIPAHIDMNAAQLGERLLLDTGLELFQELQTEPDEVRGLGISVSGLASSGKKGDILQSNKRKVAPVPIRVSRYVEGVGVVPAKRFREFTTTDARDPSPDKLGYLKDMDIAVDVLVAGGLSSIRAELSNELRIAFEESHCTRWPECNSSCMDCFNSNVDAITRVVELTEKLVKGSKDSGLVSFVRWQAHRMYGALPSHHQITQFNRRGGGLAALNECLDDINMK